MTIEKPNPNLKLQRPSVIIDTVLDPKPKQPLPAKNGFCVYGTIKRHKPGGLVAEKFIPTCWVD